MQTYLLKRNINCRAFANILCCFKINSKRNARADAFWKMKGENNVTADNWKMLPEYRITLILIKSICTLLGTSGNLLVIIHNVFMRYEKNPATIFTTNLAISDLLTCLTMYPMRIARSTMILNGFQFESNSLFLCKASYFSAGVSVSLSILTLLVVTYDRYLFIKKPLRYPLLMTQPKVCGILIAIWVTSLVIYLPLTVAFVETSEETRRGCFLILNSLSVIFLFYNYLPILLILWFNLKTLRIAQTQRRSLTRNAVWDTSTTNMSIRTRIGKELKAIRTFAVIMGLLVTCYTPYALIMLFHLADYHPGIPPIWEDIFTDLVGINSVFNPVIYCIRHKEYRKAMRRCFSALCC
jgi:hypothetical protein